MKKRHLAFLALTLLVAACDGGNEQAQNVDNSDSAARNGTADSVKDTGWVVEREPPPDTSGLPPARIVPGGRYTVKSGIVKMAGTTEKGRTATFYFDDYGAKIATHVTINDSMQGKPLIIRQVNVMEDGWSIFFDANQKVGMKSRMLEGTLNYYPNFDSLSERERVLYKYEKAAPRTIAGKQAQGHSIEQNGLRANIWVWQGIPLRTESRNPRGQWSGFEATSVQTDVPVPAGVFEVPPDVKISEMPAAPAR